MEYLTAADLRNFCLFRQKEHNGVLQAVVDQGLASVSGVRAYWTPHVCKIETKTNAHRCVRVCVYARVRVREKESDRERKFEIFLEWTSRTSCAMCHVCKIRKQTNAKRHARVCKVTSLCLTSPLRFGAKSSDDTTDA